MMNTETKPVTDKRVRAFSSDLSQSLGEHGLLALVLNAVQTVDPKRFTRPPGAKPPEYRPQMMLTLLTYCYAASIYGSQDIEWAMKHSRTVRYICARTYPEWQAIRRFRRQHRELLLQSLAYVMKQTWALKFDEGEADYVGYEWFESELVQEVNAAVLTRVDTAVLMDGVESE
jgi:transposase